jgi:hypothetical protein
MLDDFRSETGYLDYRFEDPSAGSLEEVNGRRKVLAEIGIQPVNLRVADQGETTQKLIYPFAIFRFGSRQVVVKLLENESATLSPEEVINNSVTLLEYKFANAIKKIQAPARPVILFTKGHGELDETRVADLDRSLRALRYRPHQSGLGDSGETRRLCPDDHSQAHTDLFRERQIQDRPSRDERRTRTLAAGPAQREY